MSVSQSVQSRQLVTDHMRCPILLDTHRNKAVESHRCREHIGCHCVVIVLILTHFGRNLDQRLHNTFRPAIHQRRGARCGQVLFDDVHERVGNTASHLIGRQRECHLGIEDRELRIGGVEGIFLGSCGVRDHRAVVHLRARCGERHHRRKGQHATLGATRECQLPSVTIVVNSRGYELSAVEYRATTYGKQEIDALGAALLHSTTQGFDLRVGLNAPEFDIVAAGQCGCNLFIDTVSAHATAAECDHNLLVGRDFACQACNHTATEDNLGRVAESEVIHSECMQKILYN